MGSEMCIRDRPWPRLPAQVHNLTHTSAISANFVDSTNFGAARDEIAVAALRNAEAAALLPHLEAAAAAAAAASAAADAGAEEAVDLPWAVFKRQRDG